MPSVVGYGTLRPGGNPDACNPSLSTGTWKAFTGPSSRAFSMLRTKRYAMTSKHDAKGAKLQCNGMDPVCGQKGVQINARHIHEECRLAISTAVPRDTSKALSAWKRQEFDAASSGVLSNNPSPSMRVTRRVTGGLLLAASAAILGSYGAPAPFCGVAFAQTQPRLQLPPCSGRLNGQLAAALTRAVYSSVVRLQVMDEADFQVENFKLREREYKYYVDANFKQLPRIPDLADNTGGLSNSAYFNFIQYCLWKVVYRHISTQQDREAFARAVGAEFLANLGSMPEQWEQTGGFQADARTPEAVICAAVLPFLEVLRAGGYICRYQLVLGSHPGTWPQDWMTSQPAVMYADAGEAGEVGEAGLPNSGGEFLFQLKLHRPADILSNVALRSEEDGAWPRTVSCCLMQLLEQRGLCSGTVEPTSGAAEDQQQQCGSSSANNVIMPLSAGAASRNGTSFSTRIGGWVPRASRTRCCYFLEIRYSRWLWTSSPRRWYRIGVYGSRRRRRQTRRDDDRAANSKFAT
ncbi:hypothetical protein VaNZ11_013366 [Volvox africanus]|uniref:Uncharacterized protein n=1 Tax=Volvox africanus TaxID=51714 RepID=A0ABQ5SG54_9CHLO|nr:hypothetical protein VaNZ11_013366 [Volvox africanus]